MESINFIASNWPFIILTFCIASFVIAFADRIINMPTAEQLNSMKEWLKFAVTAAEAEFGSGTGALKLRMVYESAIEKFPWVAKYMSFTKFSELVDAALVWMKDQLNNNYRIANYIESKNS